jgi:zinc and cadmium transporter
MSAAGLLTIYCALILLASLAGGWIPLLVRLTHTRLQLATSFVAGLMLGIGLLHMLPHAAAELGSVEKTVAWVLAGLLAMFFVQRYFHFHHHDVADEAPEAEAHSAAHAIGTHDHSHPHSHATLAEKSAHRLSWAGAALGLTLHTVINGIALGASVETEARDQGLSLFAGLGTFLVIFLHKPFDAMSIAALMAIGGWSKLARHVVNALFALAIPLGVLLFHLGLGQSVETASGFIGAALAFAAGSFVCIAASDLMPELQFHAHDRGKLSVSLLAGVAMAILIGHLEHHENDRPGVPEVHQENAHPHGNLKL